MTDGLQPYRPGAGHPVLVQGHPATPYGSATFAPAVMTDQRTNGVVVLVAWVVALFSFFYMLPWAIAASRGKSNATAVGLVNFLVGWTFIGWVVALAMTCGAHQTLFAGGQTINVLVAPQFPRAQLPPPSGWYPAPDGSAGQQFWDGRSWTQHRSG
jgi:hypothetical protein